MLRSSTKQSELRGMRLGVVVVEACGVVASEEVAVTVEVEVIEVAVAVVGVKEAVAPPEVATDCHQALINLTLNPLPG